MIFEDDRLKSFIHQIRESDCSLEDITLTSRSDRRPNKPLINPPKNYSSTYAEFSCDGPKATYISGPSRALAVKKQSLLRKSLDWNHLRVFYYVAQCRSFTKAADRLKVSQPALSRTVKKLEVRL